MPQQVAILHGWSDDSTSFEPLAKFLLANGYEAVPLWLGDYISLNDDVRVEDVAKRMQDVVADAIRTKGLKQPFDLIVHSTGGLVARQWLSTYYNGDGVGPITRLVMLAPANFGSRLAALGKSMLGRIVKGWNNWFQTGQEMLNGLELASPFQWDLAQRDLFVPPGGGAAPSCYGPGRVMPFVIVGTHPYPSGPRTIVNENGADGTVRVAAANLNSEGMTLDFSKDPNAPEVTAWKKRHGDLTFPLAVLPDRTHGSITTPDEPGVPSAIGQRGDLGGLILDALKCDSEKAYKAIVADWNDISEATAALAVDEAKRKAVFKDGDADPEYFRQYMQVVTRVVDDHSLPVSDFFIEFFSGKEAEERAAVYFHREILEDVHPNSQGAETRCLFVDRTDLMTRYYPMLQQLGKPQEVRAAITAAPPGDDVTYFGGDGDAAHRAGGTVKVHSIDENERWLKRNTTHFVKIVIPRIPKENVFRIRKFP
jgi:pimeloyl-ACP methyl ester carboxylesterase